MLGKAPAQVSAFGGKNPTKGIGDQIAREVEVALALPIGSLDVPHELIRPNTRNAPVNGYRSLPVLGCIGAVLWCSQEERFNADEVEEWMVSPGPVGERAFIFGIEGISMEPKFSEGDKIVVDPSTIASSGNFVAAKRSADRGITIKQLKQEGSERYLFALNPDWPDRIIHITPEWEILGVARWKISNLLG